MKKRLDVLVAEKENISRAKAQALLMSGVVFIDGKRCDKAGMMIDEDSAVEIKEKSKYVSRGALKLEKAYLDFKLNFEGKVICDVGASTGGFTDFALQSGAKKVYAVDTGYGQIDQKLRDESKVILMERTNIKEVEELPDAVDFFVIDVSFISLTRVIPAIKKIKTEGGKEMTSDVVALIKPQFEVGKEIADRAKGIIKDSEIQLAVVKDIAKFAEDTGYKVEGITESPILGAKGNKEFLIYLVV